MGFNQLKNEELQRVAEFFTKDVDAKDPENPTKKEILAALLSEDGQGPVTWDDYTKIFKEAEPANVVTTAGMAGEEKVEENSEPRSVKLAPVPRIPSPDDEDEEDVDKTLILYTGKNPTWPAIGLTFTKQHPYHSIPTAKAVWLIQNQPERFRLALPEEVADFYN